LVKLETCK
jgi:hypothetical protein